MYQSGGPSLLFERGESPEKEKKKLTLEEEIEALMTEDLKLINEQDEKER